MIKNLLICTSLFLLFFLSCTKESGNKVFIPNDNAVISAKSYSESHTLSYCFCSDALVVTKSSSPTPNLIFDWSNFFIKENGKSIAVEISLQNNSIVESYLRETIGTTEKINQTTRLIVLLDKQKKVYEQFIITKIWLKGVTPNLTKVSFNDTQEDAITLIYNVDGKLETIYSLKNGLYSFFNLQRKSLAHSLKSSTTDNLRSEMTKEQSGLYLCERCGTVNFGMTCSLCGSECVFPIDDVEVSGSQDAETTIVNNVLIAIKSALFKAMNNHTREHICYARNLNYVLPSYAELLSNWRFYGNVFADLYAITFQTFESDILPSDAQTIVKRHGFRLLAEILDLEYELTEIAEEACKSVCDPIPKPEPEPIPTPNPCSDTPCPDCGGCINPTKTDCRVCDYKHNHKKCIFCNKCIKSNDDSCISKTKSASHSTNCSSCECVCPDCGTKVNPNTGAFDCMIKISELFVSTGPESLRGFKSAFSKMMTNSIRDTLEYGGLLARYYDVEGDTAGIPAMYMNTNAVYLMVYWDKENNLINRSFTYKCAIGKDATKYVICVPNNKPAIIRYKDFSHVHTHPSYLGINQNNIFDSSGEHYMFYKDLRVSTTDMKRILQYGFIYILNENNIYELTDNDSDKGKAKIISTY